MVVSAQSQESSNETVDDSQEGESIDWASVVEQQRQQLDEQSKTSSQLRQQVAEQGEVMGRVRKAFVPDDPAAADPYAGDIAEAEAMLDHFLQAGIEAERQGHKIPLTVLNGTKLAQLAIKSAHERKANDSRFSKLEKTVSRQSDPNFQMSDRAAATIEGMADDAIEQVFGSDPEGARVRDAQYNAVIKLIGDEIKDLQKTEPARWDKIRRNPTQLRSMVNYFMHQSLPPKVREMLSEQKIQNEEQGPDELYAAFNQATAELQKAEEAGNDKAAHEWGNVIASIRQQMIGSQMAGAKRGERHSLNRVLGSMRGR